MRLVGGVPLSSGFRSRTSEPAGTRISKADGVSPAVSSCSLNAAYERHPASGRTRADVSSAQRARPPGARAATALVGAVLLRAGGRAAERRADESRSGFASEHSPGRTRCRRARALGAGGIERAEGDRGAELRGPLTISVPAGSDVRERKPPKPSVRARATMINVRLTTADRMPN